MTTDRSTEAEAHRRPKPWWAFSVARTIGDDRRTVTTFEAWRLQQALVDYPIDDGTPTTDVSIASAVADRLWSTFQGPTAILLRDEDERLADCP